MDNPWVRCCGVGPGQEAQEGVPDGVGLEEKHRRGVQQEGARGGPSVPRG